MISYVPVVAVTVCTLGVALGVMVVVAALADTAENPPRVNAAAATSAMRLIDVFVDICFLSIKVTDGNFPPVAWPRSAFS